MAAVMQSDCQRFAGWIFMSDRDSVIRSDLHLQRWFNLKGLFRSLIKPVSGTGALNPGDGAQAFSNAILACRFRCRESWMRVYNIAQFG